MLMRDAAAVYSLGIVPRNRSHSDSYLGTASFHLKPHKTDDPPPPALAIMKCDNGGRLGEHNTLEDTRQKGRVDGGHVVERLRIYCEEK